MVRAGQDRVFSGFEFDGLVGGRETFGFLAETLAALTAVLIWFLYLGLMRRSRSY